MNGYLYILQSETSGRFYVGSTSHPSRRLIQHQANAVTATKNKGPWKRVALVEFESPRLARTAEAFVKSQKSRRIINKIIEGAFIWHNLS